MKYFLYIFTYLLLGASCSSPSRPIDYGTELTKYRKVFYRFALMPDDNIKPFSNNPHQSFSIIILNKDYEIIGETKFPGNTYAHHLCFVDKKGLYISENNENNPQFDENKLVFRCFTLQGRKK